MAQLITSVGSDGKEVLSNILDRYTGSDTTFKEVELYLDGTPMTDEKVDGKLYIKRDSKYLKKTVAKVNLEEFGISIENTAVENATIFNAVQEILPDNCLVSLAVGTYNFGEVTITKSGIYDFNGVTIINNNDVSSVPVIKIAQAVEFASIVGVNIIYEGKFYTSNDFYPGETLPLGLPKSGIDTDNKLTILTACRVSGFSSFGIVATTFNRGLYANNCISNNNGYAGISSNGSDFQVIGGQYNENGGSNEAADGYGIIGNVSTNANFKCIGVTAERNRTRNIDSHQGYDLIISNNYTADAGIALPQWFNIAAEEAVNIRLTRRGHRCIISNNIAKRGKLANISFDGAVTADTRLIKQVIINGNTCEDGLYDIYIRPASTEKITISNNQSIQTGLRDAENPFSIIVLPQADPSDKHFNKDLKIIGNSCDRNIAVTLSDFVGSVYKSKINISNNTAKRISVACLSVIADVIVSGNYLTSFEIVGLATKSNLQFSNNIWDAEGSAINFTTGTSFAGKVSYIGNKLLNSSATTVISLVSNTVFRNNEILDYTNATGSVIRILDTYTNVVCVGNTIKSDTPALRAIRTTLSTTNTIKDNVHTEQIRVDLSDGTAKTINRLCFDPYNCTFDIMFTAVPALVAYPFKVGDFAKRSNPSLTTGIGWICVTAGDATTAVWKEVSGSSVIIDATTTAYTKATINAAYPTAKKDTIVIQDGANQTYIKKDDLSTGNWSVFPTIQLT